MKALCFTLLIATTACQAEDVTLNMVGNIIANVCQVDSSSQNMTVDLGQAAVSDFRDVGDTGEWKSLDITLSNCPSTTTLVTATFLGAMDSQHPTKFASTGSAKGLALELGDRQDNILLSPNASFNVVINQSNHTADFPLSARYYTTSLPVTPGTFTSMVQVTFTYQ